MTEAEYQTQKADLEAQMAALEAEWASSQEYPKWVYHATEPAQIVNTKADEDALGPGWSTSPGGPAAGPTTTGTGGAYGAAARPAPEPSAPLTPGTESREPRGDDPRGRLRHGGRA